MMGQMSYQPMPGQAAEMQMPQMPVPQSPGKKKGNVTPAGMPSRVVLVEHRRRQEREREAGVDAEGKQGKKKD